MNIIQFDSSICEDHDYKPGNSSALILPLPLVVYKGSISSIRTFRYNKWKRGDLTLLVDHLNSDCEE